MTFKAVYTKKKCATESFQCQDIHLLTDHASCRNAPATPRHLAVAFNYFAQHIQIDPTMSSNVNPNPKKKREKSSGCRKCWITFLTNHASLRRFTHCLHVFTYVFPVRNSCTLQDTPSGTKSAGTLPRQGALATPHPESSGPFATTAVQHTRWLPHCKEHLNKCLDKFEALAITHTCSSDHRGLCHRASCSNANVLGKL